MPTARTVAEALSWLSTIERVVAPATLSLRDLSPTHPERTKQDTLQKTVPAPLGPKTIREWCRGQDPVAVIGRYVALDEKGMGCCPFGSHHQHGRDLRPSLWVYQPQGTDLCCWYCHTWGRGGSLFDFLRLYYQVDASTLWRRLLSGERF